MVWYCVATSVLSMPQESSYTACSVCLPMYNSAMLLLSQEWYWLWFSSDEGLVQELHQNQRLCTSIYEASLCGSKQQVVVSIKTENLNKELN